MKPKKFHANVSSVQDVTQCEPAAKLGHLFPEMQAQKPTQETN